MRKQDTVHRVLGKEIKISPKSYVELIGPGFKKECFTDTVMITIGIGKDHTASLVMDDEAWEALKSGEKIHISTLKEVEELFG